MFQHYVKDQLKAKKICKFHSTRDLQWSSTRPQIFTEELFRERAVLILGTLLTRSLQKKVHWWHYYKHENINLKMHQFLVILNHEIWSRASESFKDGSGVDMWEKKDLVILQLMNEKSKSENMSCCSAVRMQGVRGRVRTGLSAVNSSSKLLTSCGALMTGKNGGFAFLAKRASQSTPCNRKLP